MDLSSGNCEFQVVLTPRCVKPRERQRWPGRMEKEEFVLEELGL